MDPNNYNYYLNWVLLAITGRLSESDSLMHSYGPQIMAVAKQLRGHTGLKPEKLYRGLILDATEVPGDLLLPPHPTNLSVSWTASKDVACLFADVDSQLAGVLRLTRKNLTGWLMEAKVPASKILWHYSWASLFPLVSMAHAHPQVPADQFKWSLETQVEVIAAPLGKQSRIKPIGNAGCSSTSDLESRLGYEGQ